MREAARAELEAADAEYTPAGLPDLDKSASDLMEIYNVPDAAIAEMRERYSGLTIAGLEDRKGYEVVHAARMDVRDHRLAVERTRKRLKEDSLEYGRKVDREAKRITAQLSPLEEELEAKEAIIDAERERVKAEKQRETEAKLQARVDALAKVGAPISLAEITIMTDTAFNFALLAQTEAFEAREKTRIEAEAALARQEAERLEAEAKAKAEREAKEKAEREAFALAMAEQAKAAAEMAEARAALKAEQDAFNAKQEAAERAQREEQIAKEAAEKAKAKTEQDAIEARAKAEREQEETAARAKAEAAAKPDAEKLFQLAMEIGVFNYPEMETDAGRAAIESIKILFAKTAAYTQAKAEALTKP